MTESQAKRSGCLTAFIIILIVLYALGAIGYFLAGPLLAGMVPGYTAASSIYSGILSLLSIVFLFGVWKYKKWGFYGFIAVSIINIVLSIFMGGDIITSVISGLIFPLILYFLIRPIWNNMN